MNPDDFESSGTEARCECTAEDWECAAGYSLDAQKTSCTPVKTFDASQVVPPDCSGSYLKSDGYRKKATSHCAGGVEHPRVATKCPGTWGFLSTLLFYVLRVVAYKQMVYLGAGMLALFIGGKYIYEKRSKDSFLQVPTADKGDPETRANSRDPSGARPGKSRRERIEDSMVELGDHDDL